MIVILTIFYAENNNFNLCVLMFLKLILISKLQNIVYNFNSKQNLFKITQSQFNKNSGSLRLI